MDGHAARDACAENRVLLFGERRSGKSSIERVVFGKLSPHECLFLQSTTQMTRRRVDNTSRVRYEVCDFPGSFEWADLSSDDDAVSPTSMFTGKGEALVFVIDAQAENNEHAVASLVAIVAYANALRPIQTVEVFLHKVDGDLFLTDEQKIGCQRELQAAIEADLVDAMLDVSISCHLTSIYDHSIFEAMSKVIQRLVPELPALENLLNTLVANCNMEKIFLFDMVSKIYIASDSNPVAIASYELCSDMIDAVLDVSDIYSHARDDAPEAGFSSVITLSNGVAIYLRQVGTNLGLVCFLSNVSKLDCLVDYNMKNFAAACEHLGASSRGGGGAAGGERAALLR